MLVLEYSQISCVKGLTCDDILQEQKFIPLVLHRMVYVVAIPKWKFFCCVCCITYVCVIFAKQAIEIWYYVHRRHDLAFICTLYTHFRCEKISTCDGHCVAYAKCFIYTIQLACPTPVLSSYKDYLEPAIHTNHPQRAPARLPHKKTLMPPSLSTSHLSPASQSYPPFATPPYPALLGRRNILLWRCSAKRARVQSCSHRLPSRWHGGFVSSSWEAAIPPPSYQ